MLSATANAFYVMYIAYSMVLFPPFAGGHILAFVLFVGRSKLQSSGVGG